MPEDAADEAVGRAVSEAYAQWGSIGVKALVDALEQNAVNRVRAALALDRIPKLLLSADEAAESLSLSASTIYEMAREGSIPSVKVGRALRFPIDGLRAWVIGQTR